MPKTLFVLNDPPNALRLAGSLSKRDGEEVKVFLIGDAAACAKKDQKVPQGYYNTELTDTTHRSTLEELTNWVQWADRTPVF
jgi:uncharacterized protein involved in oxidation of intracellular sulfur